MKTNAAIAGKIPVITGTLYLANSTEISLTDKDFAADSMRQTSGTSNSGEFTVGGAVIGGLEFEFWNDSGKFDNVNWYNSRVHIYFTVGNTTVDGGYYWVVDHHETGDRIRVECHDCLKILDEYEIYELNITWPSTVGTVVNAMATARSLTVTGLTTAERNIALVDPKNDHMTQRACLSYIAQILGKYVTGFGYNLRFGWYDTSTSYSAGMTFSHDLRTDMQTITGCVVSDREEANPQTRGTSSYRITIDNNPFITSDNVSSIADRIYNAVNGISYRPGDVEILSNPAIEAGDRLSVNTGNETGVIVLATSVTYKPGVRMRVTADSEPYAGDLRIKRKAYAKQVAEEVVNEALNNYHPAGDFEFIKIYGGPFELTPDAYRPGYAIDELFGHWATQGTQPESLRNVGKRYKMLLHNVNDTLETTWFTNYKLYPVGTMIVPTASSVQRAATALGVDPTSMWFTVPLSVELIAHVPKDDQQSGYVVRGGGVSVIFEAVGVFSWEGYSLYYGPNLRLRSIRITGSKTGPLGTATIADLDYPNIVDCIGHTYEDVFGDSADYDLINDPDGRPLQTFSLNTVDGFPLSIPSTAYIGLVPTDQFSGLPTGQRMWMKV